MQLICLDAMRCHPALLGRLHSSSRGTLSLFELVKVHNTCCAPRRKRLLRGSRLLKLSYFPDQAQRSPRMLYVVYGQLHCFRRDDILGASIIPVGWLGAMIAMEDRCNTICVHKYAPLLTTSSMSFGRFLLKQQSFQCSNLSIQDKCL